MKNLEELTLGTAEISGSLYKTALANKIIKYAEAKRIGRSLVTVNRDLVGNPGVTIDFPKRTYLAFDSSLTEGSDLSYTLATYSTIGATPILRGCAVKVTYQAINSSRYDLITGQLEMLGDAVARVEDSDILDAVLDRTAFETNLTGDGSETSFALTYSSIISITELLVETVTSVIKTDYTIDYKDGNVKFSTAVGNTSVCTLTGYWAGSLTVVESDTIGVLAYDDVVSAIAEVKAGNYKPDVLAVNELDVADLIKEQKFYDASMYASDVVQKTGEIGKIAGLAVVVSNNMPKGVALVIDSTRAAKLVIKRDLQIKTDPQPLSDAVAIIGHIEFDAVVVESGGICLVLCHGTDTGIGAYRA